MNPEIPINEAQFQPIPGVIPPVFARKFEELTLFYAPGYLAAARPQEAAEITGILAGELPFGNLVPHYLTRAALNAEDKWRRCHDPRLFKPVCLTLYTSLACNLKCSYCFAESERNDGLQLSGAHIMRAAKKVLANCREKNEPFTVVFHGGGEPTLDPRMPDFLGELRTICSENHIPFRSYLATNGVMEEEKALFFAKIFQKIGLSVDGPPDIQNRQRPGRDGRETSMIVERTAGIIRNVRGKLTVRVTVLPDNFSRIPEITAYCREVLEADEIRMEPAYYQATDAKAAAVFCDGFLKAKENCPGLSYSGTRIREIHGRYCHPFRQVLHLVPPKSCSACFAVSTQREAEKRKLDQPWDSGLAEKLSKDDPECDRCFNHFHCSRGCPDVCPARDGGWKDAGSFRCLVNRTLAEAELLAMAKRLLLEPARKYGFAGVKPGGE